MSFFKPTWDFVSSIPIDPADMRPIYRGLPDHSATTPMGCI